ncbi:MAG: MBOAT family protein [Betaproteobacteria bacterium]|nr:MBOAT family protein [Betaproteobacteria bacterium]
MLFNSYAFIFFFLPATLLVFFQLGRVNARLAAGWLAAASLFFYGWWNPVYVALLAVSMLFNYRMGIAIARANAARAAWRGKRLLAIAVAANLALLGYYKYANFFLDTVNAALGSSASLGEIILPLGISFFTFTQIAYLADAYEGKAREYSFVHYGLFVTWFPHLIAGPILHHREMMPQFGLAETYRPDYGNIAAGLTIFVIGLFKKVIIADGVAAYVAPVFDAPQAGLTLTFLEAWCGALAYTFQLYFDFSGYSDMAVGLSLLFGIRLPINFHSPYKAANIIEFWRHWHMTLSRFLRDYLYFPLGGNRKGPARRYLNLMATMLLGGLWHGAGWTFVVWGGLHGVYLVINHAWRALRARLGHDLGRSTAWGRAAGCAVTFAAVVAAWVVFRADSLGTAGAILRAMAGLNGMVLPDVWLARWGGFGEWLAQHGVIFGATPALARTGVVHWIWILLAVVWLAPNTQQIMAATRPALGIPADSASSRWQWRPAAASAALVAGMALAVIANLNRHSEFLYFQF